MAKIEKLPSGTYRTRVYLGKDETGKKIYKSLTAGSKMELRALAYEYVSEARNPSGLTVRQARTLTKVECFPQIRRFLGAVSSGVSSVRAFPCLRIPQTQTPEQAKKLKKYRIPY